METFFVTLPAVSSLVVVWFVGYVVHRLVHGVADQLPGHPAHSPASAGHSRASAGHSRASH